MGGLIPFGQGPVVHDHRGCPNPAHPQQGNRGREAICLRPLPRAPKFIGLLLDLNVPKGGFRHVSEFDPPTGHVHRCNGPPVPPPHPFTGRLHGHMQGVGQAACARSTRVHGGSPNKRPQLAVAIMDPLHRIASTPCGYHRLEVATHFPPLWGCLPVRQWNLDPNFHWASQPRCTGPTTRLPMGDWRGRMRG